jgi:hypothetical protein
MSRARALAIAWLVLTLCASAAAEPGDGVYGRLDGDLDLSLSAFAGARSDSSALVGGAARALYLGTAGLYATVTDEPSQDGGLRLGVGTTLRPLFLPRWSNDLERGPAWVDLALDSLAVDLGAVYSVSAAPKNTWGVDLGLGFELPLIGRATGPFIGARGVMQWPIFGANPVVIGTLGLSWHTVIDAHIVDARDALLR